MNKTIDQFDSSAEHEGKALQQTRKNNIQKPRYKKPQKMRTVNTKLLDRTWEENSYLFDK